MKILKVEIKTNSVRIAKAICIYLKSQKLYFKTQIIETGICYIFSASDFKYNKIYALGELLEDSMFLAIEVRKSQKS